MKIRISGSPDLVRGWQEMLEAEYGQAGRIYNGRRSDDLYLYIDIDDRIAEKILKLSKPSGSKALAGQ